MPTFEKDSQGNNIRTDISNQQVAPQAVQDSVKQAASVNTIEDDNRRKFINGIIQRYKANEVNTELWKDRNHFANNLGRVLGQYNFSYADIAIIKEYADTLSKKCAELMKFRKGVFASEYDEYQKHVKARNEKFAQEREAAKIKREDESITKKANKAAEKIMKAKEHEQRIKKAEKEAEDNARELYKI